MVMIEALLQKQGFLWDFTPHLSFVLTPKLKSDKRLQSSERYRDDLNKMRSEIENISDKLDALTVSKQETKDEGRLADPTNKTLIETVN